MGKLALARAEDVPSFWVVRSSCPTWQHRHVTRGLRLTDATPMHFPLLPRSNRNASLASFVQGHRATAGAGAPSLISIYEDSLVLTLS